jgi:hypothetical protein
MSLPRRRGPLISTPSSRRSKKRLRRRRRGSAVPQLPNMPSSRTEPNQSTRGRRAPAPQHRHHRHTSTSRSPGSFHRCLRSPFVPTASPDMPISELVSRRTTDATPGSLNLHVEGGSVRTPPSPSRRPSPQGRLRGG